MKIHELEYMFRFYNEFVVLLHEEYKGALNILSDREGLVGVTQEIIDKVNKKYELNGTPIMKLFVRPNEKLSRHHVYMWFNCEEIEVCSIEAGVYFSPDVRDEYRKELLEIKDI